MRRTWWMPEGVDPQQIIDMYNAGYSCVNIVKELGLLIHPQSKAIIVFLRDNDVKIRKRGPREQTFICIGCGKESIRRSVNTAKLCKECAPDKTATARFYNNLRWSGTKVTQSQVDEMFERQNGLCDICETPLETTPQIRVDHCHRQGHVRALLCNKCNIGLHYIEDDKFLANAIRYIERHKR